MNNTAVPFRLVQAAREKQLAQFNARTEIEWFGFRGAFREPGDAVIRFERVAPGALGGGGIAAINGGVIAAGFDAAFVLAGLGHYDTGVVVTLELSVKFLSLAKAVESLNFVARVTRSARHFAFAEGVLVDVVDAAARPLASASAMVAPAG